MTTIEYTPTKEKLEEWQKEYDTLYKNIQTINLLVSATKKKDLENKKKLSKKTYALLLSAMYKKNHIVLNNLHNLGDFVKDFSLYGKTLFFNVVQCNNYLWAEKLLKNRQINKKAVSDYGYSYIQVAMVYKRHKMLKFIIQNNLFDDVLLRSKEVDKKSRTLTVDEYFKFRKTGIVYSLLKKAEILLEKEKLLGKIKEETNLAEEPRKVKIL